MREFWFADLKTIGYSECAELQRKLLERRLEGEIEDTLLLLEHPPVITIGTAGGEDNLLAQPEILQKSGVEVYRTDRGGNITYHGPGQLVGYPIFDLRSHGKDIHLFLRNIEQAIIACLSDFGISGKAVTGYTGVWVENDKICSIGVAVRRWISYHGFALNVNPNFDHWSLIHPCGLADIKMTSMEKLLTRNPGMEAVKFSVAEKFAEVFGLKPVLLSAEELRA